jgi:hypothetical protein
MGRAVGSVIKIGFSIEWQLPVFVNHDGFEDEPYMARPRLFDTFMRTLNVDRVISIGWRSRPVTRHSAIAMIRKNHACFFAAYGEYA